MPTVVIEHEASIWIREGLTIVMDGHVCGALEPDSKTTFLVEPGAHKIWLTSKSATSPIVSFQADAREEYGFACGASGFMSKRITLRAAYVRKPTNRFAFSRSHAGPGDHGTPMRSKSDGSDWAAVLGVPLDAPPHEVRQAYLKRIGVYHPDRVGRLPQSARAVAEEEARRLNLAYRAAKSAVADMRAG